MYNLKLGLVLIITFVVSSKQNAYAQINGTGLKFATPEEVRMITDAGVPYSGKFLPNSVDLSNKMPPPGNQGSQNSCAAWAVGYALKSYEVFVKRKGNYFQTLNDGSVVVNADKVFSPSFIYNQLNNGYDGGISLPSALNLLIKTGDVPWSEMPYDEKNFVSQPSKEILNDALKYRSQSIEKIDVNDEINIKAQLNAGFPIVVGLSVDGAFINGRLGLKRGKYVWDHYEDNQRSAHAVVIIGYDDYMNAYKIINSWGTRWANSGYCWISYPQFKIATRECYIAKDSDWKDFEEEKTNVNDRRTVFSEKYFIKKEYVNTNSFVNGDQGLLVSDDISIYTNPGHHFYMSMSIFMLANNKGYPIRSSNFFYADIKGNIATYSPISTIPVDGVNNLKISLFIPYNAIHFDGHNRQIDLGYQTALWIDNYVVVYGPMHSLKWLVQ
ncbi:C1 family peptidase [Mucilaginibacter sp. L3T2-6]|uniref:C1 family peptidase n=1 Tax=Mucilaginibacter sp. L3T2-6 TaxID=3062491 RepID=UPI00267461FE|nr:C1 family peptidase [Mucilaginibacter sp. L3T2-6]MDO3643843.1 C1 family peptidase [Mucilaginibacter sp. L3T2-6]MDV6216294.1 C1 family peptidase [Mucilaginibacter sp. L3T2-6]